MKHSKKTIVFTINSDEFIHIDLPCNLQDLFQYDEVTVTYLNIKTHKKYIINALNCIIDVLKDFVYHLENAMDNKLKLHSSITQNIGYLWDQYYGSMRDGRYKKPNLTYETSPEGREYWVGSNYMFLATPCNQIPNVMTWLYEKGGTFFLEITPNYPPDYRWDQMKLKDAKKDPNFKTFKQFMETYEPLVVTTIERSTLEQWYKQVQQLIPLIEANDSKYF